MLNKVGDTEIKSVHRSTCHCGAVELEIKLPDGIVDPRRSHRLWPHRAKRGASDRGRGTVPGFCQCVA